MYSKTPSCEYGCQEFEKKLGGLQLILCKQGLKTAMNLPIFDLKYYSSMNFSQVIPVRFS